jgi:1,2-dihydroxy-3-keto-5-methylthiopentene dioxygenase
MQIYYYDNGPGDQREPHDSGRPVPTEVLTSIDVYASTHPTIDTVNALAVERGYKNRDEITISPATMGDAYEGKVKIFFTEHLHDDEEIRYILDGRGYFDVRSGEDEWIRCGLEKGDLIILPKGIWHRFTTDDTNVSAALRWERVTADARSEGGIVC